MILFHWTSFWTNFFMKVLSFAKGKILVIVVSVWLRDSQSESYESVKFINKSDQRNPWNQNECQWWCNQYLSQNYSWGYPHILIIPLKNHRCPSYLNASSSMELIWFFISRMDSMVTGPITSFSKTCKPASTISKCVTPGIGKSAI